VSGVVRARADERVELGVINQSIGQCAVLVGDVVNRGMEVLPQIQWELMQRGLVSREGNQSRYESASAERIASELELERPEYTRGSPIVPIRRNGKPASMVTPISLSAMRLPWIVALTFPVD
jgi:hypothetical protein